MSARLCIWCKTPRPEPEDFEAPCIKCGRLPFRHKTLDPKEFRENSERALLADERRFSPEKQGPVKNTKGNDGRIHN